MPQRWNVVLTALKLLAFVAVLGAPAAEAQQTGPNPRIALVIGNATYRDAALATTANDAGLIAQTLQTAGFDVVGARDLDGQSLRTALRDFLEKAAAAGPDMQAFVYLSGRGVQYAGDNYFVPVDAQINRDADVPIEAVRVSDFNHALAAMPGRARIVVLDAARANPYAAQGSPLAQGLALVDPEPGELIAFNAAPGTLAGDEQGPWGVYGKTLAGAIRQGGVDIAQVFDQTRVAVNTETQGALAPWSASKLDGAYYIFERAADAPPPALPSPAQTASQPIASFPASQAYTAALDRDTIEGYRDFLAAYPDSDQARRVRAILAVRREAAYWRRAAQADTPRAYWTYLRTYPRGPHIGDARRRLAMLSAGYEPPADFEPEMFADLPPPPPDELVYDEQPIYAFDDFGPPPPPPPVQFVYVADDDWVDLPPPPPPVEIGVLPVLAIALPVAVGAVAYQGLFHRDGIAPLGAPRWQPPPPAPPPLPANIRPVAPPPVALAARPPAAAIVKPLPPIGRVAAPGAPGAAPGTAPAAAPPSPAGTRPRGNQPQGLGGAPAPAAPGGKPLPVPSPNAGKPAAPAPAAAAPAPAAPGGKPLPVPSPNAGKPAAPAPTAAAPAPAAPGGKPLPVPSPNAGKPAAPSPAAAAPAPAAPGGKPLPVPSPNAGKPAPPSPAAAAPAPAALGGKPLQVPSPNAGKPAPPSPAAAAPAPAAPGGKPLLPSPNAGKPAAPAPAAGAPAPAAPGGKPLPVPSPNAGKPAAPAPAAGAPAPAAPFGKPLPAPTPASIPAPKPNVAAKPPAAPPAPRPPAVVHAPAPPPAAAPAFRPPPPVAAAPPAFRPPPPAPRAPQGPAQSRACGAPGLPPCPK
jgi:uncharacterized caspase-like protein